MAEEHQDRRKTKTHTRQSASKHGFGSTTRLAKQKATARAHSSTDLLAEANTEHQPVAGLQRHNRNNSRLLMRSKVKKSVIQLERSDSDDENEDFTDVESGDEQAAGGGGGGSATANQRSRSSSAKRRADAERIPTPGLSAAEPKLSSEQVLSLSDAAAVRTKQMSGTFLDESDFVSSVVVGGDDDIRSVFGEQSMRTVGNLSRQKGRKEPTQTPTPRKERDRLNERIFKQYFNITNIQHPVIESISRVQQGINKSQQVPTSTQRAGVSQIFMASPLAKKPHNDLKATPLTQLDDSDAGDIGFLLGKMWQEGWVDPEKTPQDTPQDTPLPSQRASPQNGIGQKAKWAAQRLSNANLKREGIKLA